MRHKKELLHTLPGVFCDDAPETDLAVAMHTFNQNPRKFCDRVFVTDLIDWYSDNYRALLQSLKMTPGIKLRIPVVSRGHFRGQDWWVQESITLLRTFFSIADLIVFSPAPIWKCSYVLLGEHPWPEFSSSDYGCNNIFANDIET